MPYIEQREMTAGQWTALNPVLLKGELGWESGATPKAKKGDGVTAWNSLPYAVVPVPDTSSFAPKASPVFTGDPQAPTPATADNDTSIATTAFVQNVVTALGVSAKAPLASPAFTGNPTAPTPTAGDNDTSIATTAFVQAVAALLAPLASPTLTGDPKAPTPATTDNDTSIATTAFVKAALASILQFGTVTLDPAGTTAGQATVTFPTPFTGAGVPACFAIMNNGTAAPVYAVKVTGASNTGVTVRMDNVGGTTHTGLRDATWIAIKVS